MRKFQDYFANRICTTPDSLLEVSFCTAVGHFFAKILPGATFFIFLHSKLEQILLLMLSAFMVFKFARGCWSQSIRRSLALDFSSFRLCALASCCRTRLASRQHETTVCISRFVAGL